jgi:hypothetical protein
VNPFIQLYEQPVEALTAGAYALVLLAALVATWYAGTRNALYLVDRYQHGWRYLPSLWWTARAIGLLLIAALDLLLVAGILHVLS